MAMVDDVQGYQICARFLRETHFQFISVYNKERSSMLPVSFFLQNTKNKSKPAVALKLLKKPDLDLAFWFQSLQLLGSTYL